ncbi:MAG: hypothetical protein SNJ71_02075 [Bacteroidales bacterium]
MVNDFICSAIQADYYEERGMLPFGRLIADNYIRSLPDDIVYVSASDGYSVWVDKKGHIFACGSNYFNECNIPNINSPIVKVATGATHVLALSKNGEVFSWGSYEVPKLDNLIVYDISCTRWSSVLLSHNKQIVVYGVDPSIRPLNGLKDVSYINSNDYSVLAIQMDFTLTSCGLINLRKKISKNVISAHFYDNDIIVLRDDGRIYSLLKKQKFNFKNIVSISSNSKRFFALNDKGQIFIHGDNFFGKLDPPNDDGYCMVSAGSYHALAIKNGKILGWGTNYCNEINF